MSMLLKQSGAYIGGSDEVDEPDPEGAFNFAREYIDGDGDIADQYFTCDIVWSQVLGAGYAVASGGTMYGVYFGDTRTFTDGLYETREGASLWDPLDDAYSEPAMDLDDGAFGYLQLGDDGAQVYNSQKPLEWSAFFEFTGKDNPCAGIGHDPDDVLGVDDEFIALVLENYTYADNVDGVAYRFTGHCPMRQFTRHSADGDYEAVDFPAEDTLPGSYDTPAYTLRSDGWTGNAATRMQPFRYSTFDDNSWALVRVRITEVWDA